MGSRGDCWDKAVAESFFATLKKELIYRRCWPTKAEPRTEVFEYVEVLYNRRRESSPGLLRPRSSRRSPSIIIKNNCNPPNHPVSSEAAELHFLTAMLAFRAMRQG